MNAHKTYDISEDDRTAPSLLLRAIAEQMEGKADQADLLTLLAPMTFRTMSSDGLDLFIETLEVLAKVAKDAKR